MSGCYGSSRLSHKHLATLTRDTVCTRSIEELIYLSRINVMTVFFTSIWIVLILCLPTKLLILLKMECLWRGAIQRYTLNFIITIHKVLDPFCITSYPSVPLYMFLDTLILFLFTNVTMFISCNFHLIFLQHSHATTFISSTSKFSVEILNSLEEKLALSFHEVTTIRLFWL